MRHLSNQCDTVFCMTSAWGIVVRIGVNMGVGNDRATNRVRMDKESSTCTVTYKKRCEKE